MYFFCIKQKGVLIFDCSALLLYMSGELLEETPADSESCHHDCDH